MQLTIELNNHLYHWVLAETKKDKPFPTMQDLADTVQLMLKEYMENVRESET